MLPLQNLLALKAQEQALLHPCGGARAHMTRMQAFQLDDDRVLIVLLDVGTVLNLALALPWLVPRRNGLLLSPWDAISWPARHLALGMLA